MGESAVIRRVLSVLLCLSLLAFLPATTVYAANKITQGALPFVVVRGLDFNGLYLDYGTDTQRNFADGFTAEGVSAALLGVAAAGVSGFSTDAAVNELIAYADDMFGMFACDNTGASVSDLGYDWYPNAIGTYPDYVQSDSCEFGIIKTACERYGADKVYLVTYDWRMDPLLVADQINEVINNALSASGAEKVNLVNASMGGVMTVAYMTKYGYAKLNDCIFLSSTFYGLQIVSELFQGKLKTDANNLYNVADYYLGNGDEKAEAFLKIMNMFGVFDGVSDFANDFFDKYKEKVYDEVLLDTFGHMLSIWSLVLPEDYDACVSYMFGDKLDEMAAFIEKTDALQAMMVGRDALLKDAAAHGVRISVSCSYGVPAIPVYESAYLTGDGGLETAYMSGGATCAPYGKTLDESVLAASPHASPDGCIDASTCLFPDSTWFLKGGGHVAYNYGTDCMSFLFWLIDYDGQPTIGADTRYPQFMQTDDSMTLSPLV